MHDDRGVLIIDDDPVHLQIYGWILKSAGFVPFPALARANGVELPANQSIDAVVLDYRLTGGLTATDAARLANQAFPDAPIILLSDLYEVPDDIAPYVRAFVRKGEPEKLIAAVKKYTHVSDE